MKFIDLAQLMSIAPDSQLSEYWRTKCSLAKTEQEAYNVLVEISQSIDGASSFAKTACDVGSYYERPGLNNGLTIRQGRGII